MELGPVVGVRAGSPQGRAYVDVLAGAGLGLTRVDEHSNHSPGPLKKVRPQLKDDGVRPLTLCNERLQRCGNVLPWQEANQIKSNLNRI